MINTLGGMEMKRIAYLTLALTLSLSLPLHADLGLELIPNGDFAKLDANGWGVGWPQGRNAKIAEGADGKRLVLDGAHAQVNFVLPLKPEWGQLRLATQMKVTGVELGKESWNTGRLTLCFMDDAGQRVGAWPDVFGFTGTTGWQPCERTYPIPKGATKLSICPCNLGASGTVEFRALSLKVSRIRAAHHANAPLPDGAPKDVWGLGDAWRQATPTRENISLNGLWGFRPVLTNEAAALPPAPADCWGWFKVPGIWPGKWEGDTAPQRIWLSPWLEENVEDAAAFEQAWYKRTLTVPQSFEGKRVALDFTMLQTHAKVFVDGRDSGEVWYPGGTLDLTGRLVPGKEHELILLVTARPFSATHQAFMAPDRIIETQASVKLRGITGDLYLTATPPAARLDGVHIVTSLRDGTVTFIADVAGHSPVPYRLRAEVTGSGDPKTFTSRDLPVWPDGTIRFPAVVKAPKRWDTHTPHNLCAATLSLLDADGNLLDTLPPVTFGFREFRIEGRDLILNGTPIHLRALHNTTMNAPADKASKAAALEHCRRIQGCGFNFIIAGNYDFAAGSTGYLDGLMDACDETGTLLAFSLPHMKDFGHNLQDPGHAERYRQQALWLIRRARNHPSVIFYAMSHNACGYYGDQNPLKIDGIYAPPEKSDAKGAWWENNRRQALAAAAIASALDPTRPIYHHQSGNLGPMHTVNIYLNWAPRQERTDWLQHWAAHGEKPLFFVEWGLPHISSWSSYRGPKFIWSSPALQSLWASEYAAQFWGDAAYQATPEAHAALAHEEKLWATGQPFPWHQLNRPLRDLTHNYLDVQAYFAHDNWRAHRAHGISAMLPWDQEGLWRRTDRDPPPRPAPGRIDNLKRPGISPDNLLPGYQYINDTGDPSAFTPTSLGQAFLRWNMPDCAFIGGADEFTDKTHHYKSSDTVNKTLVILNDRRTPQTVSWACTLTREDTPKPKALKKLNGTVTIPPGGQARVPVSFKLPADADNFTLNATFTFAGKVTQTDTFAIRSVNSLPNMRTSPSPALLLYDTKGITAQHFDRLKLGYTPIDKQFNPSDDNGKKVIVIGRESLDETSAQWVKNAKDGLQILVMEQPAKPLAGLLGFRIAERGSRLFFPRVHQIFFLALSNLDTEDLRDWAGSSTLLPEHLDDLDALELHDPHWQWCGQTSTRVWRCGNRNSVASVLIEKPAVGDWLALIDGEFDLQYSPLLQHVGNGSRIIFCQLDVSGRTTPDPVADNLTRRLMNIMLTDWKGWEDSSQIRAFGFNIPKATNTSTILGENAKQLCASLGVQQNAYTKLIVASTGAEMPNDLHQQIADGANVLCLGMNAEEIAKWCPVPMTATFTNAFFTRIENIQYQLQLNGLSNADWAWHGQMGFYALSTRTSESNQALRVVSHGDKGGCIVFWQVPPWQIDEVKKPYLRTTKRRANAMASRLLANLGAAFAPALGRPLYLDTPENVDDPYRYYRW